MRQSAELETWMTSVKRILQYGKLKGEEEETIKSQVPIAWPHSGKIEFRNVFLRYDQKGKFVLKDICFKAKSGEKVCFMCLLVRVTYILYSDWHCW